MLTLKVYDEFYSEEEGKFLRTNEMNIEMEHSLVALSKWESKWEIPFLTDTPRTDEQTIDYIRFMCINIHPSDLPTDRLTEDHLKAINAYIKAKMTATIFNTLPGEKTSHSSASFITSEIIYYWMVTLNIPVEFEMWHINRLLTLIKVINQKNQPEKKMSARDLKTRQQALNAQRRQQMGTTG